MEIYIEKYENCYVGKSILIDMQGLGTLPTTVSSI